MQSESLAIRAMFGAFLAIALALRLLSSPVSCRLRSWRGDDRCLSRLRGRGGASPPRRPQKAAAPMPVRRRRGHRDACRHFPDRFGHAVWRSTAVRPDVSISRTASQPRPTALDWAAPTRLSPSAFCSSPRASSARSVVGHHDYSSYFLAARAASAALFHRLCFHPGACGPSWPERLRRRWRRKRIRSRHAGRGSLVDGLPPGIHPARAALRR